MIRAENKPSGIDIHVDDYVNGHYHCYLKPMGCKRIFAALFLLKVIFTLGFIFSVVWMFLRQNILFVEIHIS